MIKSMTGFGRAELKDEEKTILVEIRSLNSKYLKINIRMPDSLLALEDRIEKILRKELSRGTINLILECKTLDQELKCMINRDALREYNDLISEIRKEISSEQEISLERLISLPGVLEYKKETGNGEVTEELWPELERLIMLAVNDLEQMKGVEGENLQSEIERWKDRILNLLDRIEAKSPIMVHEYRDRIQERVSSLLEGTEIKLEKDDLCKEIAIFAGKCDISEELGRLRSHLSLLSNTMEKEQPSGRKLEFIVQEMFREANTIAAKSNNAEITKDVIEIKTEIERIKEQVFNVE